MKKNLLFKSSLILVLLLLGAGLAMGQNTIPKQEGEKLGIFEHLDTILSPDIILTESTGEVFILDSLIDKPTIINLVYYRCPGICPALLNGLSNVVKETDMVLGKDYDILTISFDPGETSFLAKKKRDNYLRINKNQDVEHGWRFFSADTANVQRLLDEIGFQVKKSERGGYIHAAGIVMVSPERKVTRYLNGVYYSPFDFKLALIEASEGRSGPTINKVLDYCFSYDPQGKRYTFDILKVSGSLVLFMAVILLFFMLRAERKRKKQINNQDKN